MKISRQVAEEVARRVSESSAACESTLRVVTAHQSLGEVTVYGRLVANFMGHTYIDVLRPIWKLHPDLEPESMKGPYVEPVAELAPEVEAALAAFVADARATLSFAHAQLSSETEAGGPPFDGLSEVEGALHEIEFFLEHPRFNDVQG